MDTAVAGGQKKKLYAHADAFWAKALSDLAADEGTLALDATPSSVAPSFTQLEGIL